MRTLRNREKFVACLIFAAWMGTAGNARSEPCWPGAPAQQAAEADKKQILNVTDAAQLISRFELKRPQHPQYGINTRLMRKVGDRWVIALNHVSASETPPSATPSADERR